MFKPLKAKVEVRADGSVRVESAPLLIVATVEETEGIVWTNVPGAAGFYDWTGVMRTRATGPSVMMGHFKSAET